MFKLIIGIMLGSMLTWGIANAHHYLGHSETENLRQEQQRQNNTLEGMKSDQQWQQHEQKLRDLRQPC